MPKREDIESILIIGSGPIVIGQACEFDYSGTQACKVLKDDGYRVILINSNPATIMTDPEFADKTYIEPITASMVEKIIAKERPDALLPTLGGQTGLNVAVELAESGALARYGVEMIGADLAAIKKAEDRSQFRQAMRHIGLDIPTSGFAYNLEEAFGIAQEIGFPLVIRPSFTMGGAGGSLVYNLEEFKDHAATGLSVSPIREILIEESVVGWKEFELEVMRDCKDNVVIVCSIENFDPMGVHTGDSITVAPAQTLTDVEYQRLRDAAIAIIREIGVETGGSNIQFAVNPENGRVVIIEMNPRVSRSSALASKATGFPIAKIAAKLAVGYTLDEIDNDITKETPASFEPAIDYVVTKIPRFAFEKFPGADDNLTIRMKSVGEVMSIGRTFKESIQKAIRAMENGRDGFNSDHLGDVAEDVLYERLRVPNPNRLFYLHYALSHGFDIEDLANITRIDPWFLDNLKQIIEVEEDIKGSSLRSITAGDMRLAKETGFSDSHLGRLLSTTETAIRDYRISKGILPTYKLVDTCAAEFEAYTPYYYSTYETESEIRQSNKDTVVILGSGPNRIGQGIEFDYCCVHASFALREDGFETVMVNCNPETVSTDYDTSDYLFFEPLTFEDVMNIIEAIKPVGVIVQLGGQTPLKLAGQLEQAGVKLMGTSFENIDLAEDRKRFGRLLKKLELKQPPNGTARSVEEAKRVAREIGFPVLIRPSYVLGGRAMEIVYSEAKLETYMETAVKASPEHPILIDKFLEGAIEIDVDAVADGRDVFIGAIMEHIEEAGIHSGDSACCLPPYSLKANHINEIRHYTKLLAKELNVIGLINIQYALKGEDIFVLEVNPRASRTVPFVSKAVGIPLAKMASRVMTGKTIKSLPYKENLTPQHFAIKEAVLPFARFPEVDTVLGPEMKSTGEVMGIDKSFGRAFAKAEMAASAELPIKGKAFISVNDRDKKAVIPIARSLSELGFEIVATAGTAAELGSHKIKVSQTMKVMEGRPNVVDMIKNNEIDLVINTPLGRGPRTDGYYIRTAAVAQGVPCITTIAAALAAIQGIESTLEGELGVMAIQDYFDILDKPVLDTNYDLKPSV